MQERWAPFTDGEAQPPRAVRGSTNDGKILQKRQATKTDMKIAGRTPSTATESVYCSSFKPRFERSAKANDHCPTDFRPPADPEAHLHPLAKIRGPYYNASISIN